MCKYSDLFNFLLSNYSYQQVIMSTNYIIKRWKDNKGLDENGQVIENKYGYFKAAMENNLIKISTYVSLGWE